MKLRVGVVGLGGTWENRYRPALRVLSDRFEVRAVYDDVGHRAERTAREFDARPVDGVRALAERTDVDVILQISPTWLGTLPLQAAAQAGKAVYCAADLELPLQAARQLRDQVNESGIAFMSELSRRHAPATVRLKELIATRLGAPRLLFGHFRRPGRRPPLGQGDGIRPEAKPQRTQSALSEDGHALADLVEYVDWCRYVVGSEPTSVLGILHRNPEGQGDGAEDYQMLSLDFSAWGQTGTGPLAQISCGRYMMADWEEAVTFRPPAGLQVSCEKGVAFVDLPAKVIWFDDAGRHQESLDSERPLGEQLLLRFYRSVTSLVRQASCLDDICRALEILAQAHQSHQTGQRMSVAADQTP